MTYDEEVCYNSKNTENYYADTDILEIIAPQEEYPANNIQNCLPSDTSNVRSRKDITILATILFDV
jgi:hypothetical protein